MLLWLGHLQKNKGKRIEKEEVLAWKEFFFCAVGLLILCGSAITLYLMQRMKALEAVVGAIGLKIIGIPDMEEIDGCNQ